MTDKQLIEFCRAFRRGILGRRKSRGCCFMVCAPLATLLCIHGVEVELIESDAPETHQFRNHFWLHLADGRVLDPTADQFEFGLPPVYLGPPDPRIHTAKQAYPAA